MLKFNAINFSYGSDIILKNISFTLNKGQVITLTGPSGAGKSTLLKIGANFIKPDSGKVAIEKNLPQKIVLLQQELYLWPHLTIKENILLVNKFSPSSLSTREIDFLIRILNITPLLNRYPRQISGGQRQRAALIRAISARPDYLLLDEPTSALDRKNIKIVLRILKVIKQKGVGMIIVSHEPELLAELSDSTYLIENGSLYLDDRYSYTSKVSPSVNL